MHPSQEGTPAWIQSEENSGYHFCGSRETDKVSAGIDRYNNKYDLSLRIIMVHTDMHKLYLVKYDK
jgi:hypothetical protein